MLLCQFLNIDIAFKTKLKLDSQLMILQNALQEMKKIKFLTLFNIWKQMELFLKNAFQLVPPQNVKHKKFAKTRKCILNTNARQLSKFQMLNKFRL